MYVMTVHVNMGERTGGEGQAMLDDEVVPRAKAAPGFVRGLWFGDGREGEGVLVFDNREHAEEMAAHVSAPEGGPISIERVRVFNLNAEA
jgi:hypothetical protein